MCTVSVGDIIFKDATIQGLMARPSLDLIHKQVLITLYALDFEKRLADLKTMLPIYLSMDWENCEKILVMLESEGLITMNSGSIVMNYPLKIEENDTSCGCMA
jgi:ABC-type metal ion transport system substrate-binding protein